MTPTELKNWRIVKIEEIGEVIGGGTPSTNNPEYFGGDISWITPKDLSDHKEIFIEKGERSITKKGLQNSAARLLPEGTVLFTSRAPIGYIAIAKNEVTTNQGFKSIICNSKLVNNKFVFYVLTYNKNKIESISSGSTFKEVSGTALKNFEILLPPLNEQIKIANILFELDSKIEINQQMNKTLEAICQAIFKQWFIDFEFINEKGKPYRSSGGQMIESELGEIPKGWKVEKFSKIMSIRGRIGWKGYTTEDLVDEGPWVIGGREINSGYISFTNCKHITQIKYDESPEIKLLDKDIILAKTGTIGPVAMYRDYMGNGTINPNVAIIRAVGVISEYILYLLKTEKCQHHLKEFQTASVQPAINQETIRNMNIIIPEEKIQKKYESLILSITNLINHNVSQIDNLQIIRDSLLPKLMSGKIRVPVEVLQ